MTSLSKVTHLVSVRTTPPFSALGSLGILEVMGEKARMLQLLIEPLTNGGGRVKAGGGSWKR